jgi:soluble cytochrome b562
LQILANIESAQRNNRLFAALKEGNSALADLQKQVSLEEVEKLNEQSAEAKDYQDQLRDLLAQSLSAEDDADALEELEKIQVGACAASREGCGWVTPDQNIHYESPLKDVLYIAPSETVTILVAK